MAREMTVNVHKTFSTKDDKTRVCVQDYGNPSKKYLDIRKCFEQDGEMIPTRKGISMDGYDLGKFLDMIRDNAEEIGKMMGVDIEPF